MLTWKWQLAYMLLNSTLDWFTNLPSPWVEGEWILVYLRVQVHCWRTHHDSPSWRNCVSCGKTTVWVLRPWDQQVWIRRYLCYGRYRPTINLDVLQCFSEDPWHYICQPRCFSDNLQQDKEPIDLLVHVIHFLLYFWGQRLTWNVNVIDLYSIHVTPDNGSSRFFIIVSCSSCKCDSMIQKMAGLICRSLWVQYVHETYRQFLQYIWVVREKLYGQREGQRCGLEAREEQHEHQIQSNGLRYQWSFFVQLFNDTVEEISMLFPWRIPPFFKHIFQHFQYVLPSLNMSRESILISRHWNQTKKGKWSITCIHRW